MQNKVVPTFSQHHLQIDALAPNHDGVYCRALTFLRDLYQPESLTTMQEVIFSQCWAGHTYQEIADQAGYDASYIRKSGSQLWRFLSDQLGEEVKKSNFQIVLKRHLEQQHPEPAKNSDWNDTLAVKRHQLVEKQKTTSDIASEMAGSFTPQLNTQIYIERAPIERRCCETLLQEGSLIRIKGSYQMGKTTLMNRILAVAQQQKFQTITLSFRLANDSVVSSVDRFLRWLCATVGHQLGLPNQVEDEWDEIFGESYNCTHYFETHLLNASTVPLVLALDDVDILFQKSVVATNFFRLLRAWHEKAKHGDIHGQIWKRLRLIVVHSTEVYIPLHHHQSPFNIGLSIKLPDFTACQLQAFAQAYGLNCSDQEIAQLSHLIGGHPGLARLTLKRMAQEGFSLCQILEFALKPEGIYRDYLHRQLRSLQPYPDLLPLVSVIMHAEQPVTIEALQAIRLESLGIIRLQGAQAIPSCELHRQYFKTVLRDASC